MDLKNNIFISVIGLGYVGLPVAVAFDKNGYNVLGFDIDKERVKELSSNFDRTGEVVKSDLAKSRINFSARSHGLKKANFHIITVPTPIDEFKSPDLKYLENACSILGDVLKKNDIVVIESTVYPGVTEEILVPILETCSNLKLNEDFTIGYSPERINPADKIYKFENIKKVVSGSNIATLDLMEKVYSSVITAGIHKAPSIRVAEAAKVIENSQRDLNIAFMNELVRIFNGININTNDVLDAAETKWNFLPFRPGLVGGHCIGVDPYYLIHKSLQAGVIPDLLMSARKINDGMSTYFSNKILSVLNENNINLYHTKILVLGLAFKENCPDMRNSKVFDLISDLQSFKINVDVFDPIVDAKAVRKNYSVNLVTVPKDNQYNFIVIAVSHQRFKDIGIKKIRAWCKDKSLVMDLKNTFPNNQVDYTA